MSTKIYCIKNQITGDIYIGSTTQPINKRLYQHSYSHEASHRKLCQSMSDYGLDNFTIHVIYECEEGEDRFKKEQEFIEKLKPALNSRPAYPETSLLSLGENSREKPIEIQGKAFNSINEACRYFGTTYTTVYQRIVRLGWDADKAITTPPRKANKQIASSGNVELTL